MFTWSPEMIRWPEQVFRDRIYNDEYPIVDPEYKTFRPNNNFSNVENFLAGQLKESEKILDYGSGTGLLGKKLKSRRWNVTNYEPFNGDKMPEDKYTLITCFEVLEHVPNPHKIFSDFKNLTTYQGRVLFSTALINKNNTADWWYLSPRNGHICAYSIPALKILCEKYNFAYKQIAETFHVLQNKNKDI